MDMKSDLASLEDLLKDVHKHKLQAVYFLFVNLFVAAFTLVVSIYQGSTFILICSIINVGTCVSMKARIQQYKDLESEIKKGIEDIKKLDPNTGG